MVSSKWNPESKQCPCEYCDCVLECDASGIGAYGCTEWALWNEITTKEVASDVLDT